MMSKMSTATALLALAVLALSATTNTTSNSLAQLALQQILFAASPVFGPYHYNATVTNYTTWMKPYPDSTSLYHLNIPGTHDSSTWNYTQATQDSLLHITDLDGVIPSPAAIYQCQQKSYFDMLQAGIRAFDIRYSFDATNSSLVLYHSAALQSETALLTDVMFGFYSWLDQHPSETLLLSFMHESGTLKYDPINADVQRAIYNVLTTPAAKQYIVQVKDRLVNLGKARGKIQLLRRFDLDLLNPSYENSIPGLHFPPSKWVVNGPSFTIPLSNSTNTTSASTAHLEDFYNILAPLGSPATLAIQWKLNATLSHFSRALTASSPYNASTTNDLYWGFASSEYDTNYPVDTPRIMALGNGTGYTPSGGVNQHLLGYFRNLSMMSGGLSRRLGIVMFDFFDEPKDLIPAFLGLLKP